MSGKEISVSFVIYEKNIGTQSTFITNKTICRESQGKLSSEGENSVKILL